MKVLNNINFPKQNILNKQEIKPLKKIVPFVTIPMVNYYVGESQDNTVAEILKFFKRKNIKIPDYLQPHADTKTGWNSQSQTKIKKALEKAHDKHIINDDDYEKYAKKVSFTSREHTDGHLDIHDLSDTPSVSEIRDIDVSMPIELQEYMDTPMDHVQDGLISDIFGEFPDDFDVDEGLLSKLRGFIEHIEEMF